MSSPSLSWAQETLADLVALCNLVRLCFLPPERSRGLLGKTHPSLFSLLQGPYHDMLGDLDSPPPVPQGTQAPCCGRHSGLKTSGNRSLP